jgi:hypothetical protein
MSVEVQRGVSMFDYKGRCRNLAVLKCPFPGLLLLGKDLLVLRLALVSIGRMAQLMQCHVVGEGTDGNRDANFVANIAAVQHCLRPHKKHNFSFVLSCKIQDVLLQIINGGFFFAGFTAFLENSSSTISKALCFWTKLADRRWVVVGVDHGQWRYGGDYGNKLNVELNYIEAVAKVLGIGSNTWPRRSFGADF